MTKIKIAIADDHKAFRKAIIRTIHIEKDLEVIIEAENGADLLRQIEIKTPDIVLMDIRMPVMNGVEATDKIKEHYPQIKVIAYSQYDLEGNIIEMYVHGVKSFIGKEDETEELFKAVRIVYEGGVYMTDRSAEIVQRYLSNKNQIIEPPNLNDFQLSLLRAICKGQSSTEIGKILNKSPRTIEEHRENLYRRFGVRTKEGLLREAYKNDLV